MGKVIMKGAVKRKPGHLYYKFLTLS